MNNSERVGRIRWRYILGIPKPRWTVEVLGLGGGYFRRFWTFREARKFFDLIKMDAPLVTISDEWHIGHGSSSDYGGTVSLTLATQDNRDDRRYEGVIFAVPKLS